MGYKRWNYNLEVIIVLHVSADGRVIVRLVDH